MAVQVYSSVGAPRHVIWRSADAEGNEQGRRANDSRALTASTKPLTWAPQTCSLVFLHSVFDHIIEIRLQNYRIGFK